MGLTKPYGCLTLKANAEVLWRSGSRSHRLGKLVNRHKFKTNTTSYLNNFGSDILRRLYRKSFRVSAEVFTAPYTPFIFIGSF
jgi:hypothetical protein